MGLYNYAAIARISLLTVSLNTKLSVYKKEDAWGFWLSVCVLFVWGFCVGAYVCGRVCLRLCARPLGLCLLVLVVGLDGGFAFLGWWGFFAFCVLSSRGALCGVNDPEIPFAVLLLLT